MSLAGTQEFLDTSGPQDTAGIHVLFCGMCKLAGHQWYEEGEVYLLKEKETNRV